MQPTGLNEDWTADVVGRMHKYRITNVQLADACGYTPQYVSIVLNGRKTFENEKTKQKTKDQILDALKALEERIITNEEKANATDSTKGDSI